MSLLEETHTYAVGAAHGNMNFDSRNFFLDQEHVIPFTIEDILDHDHDALALISSIVIDKLKAEYWKKTGEEPDKATVEEWFTRGAGPEWGNFENFTVYQDGIKFYFPPYQVHAYAYGQWTVDISFFELRAIDSFGLLRGVAALEVPAD